MRAREFARFKRSIEQARRSASAALVDRTPRPRNERRQLRRLAHRLLRRAAELEVELNRP